MKDSLLNLFCASINILYKALSKEKIIDCFDLLMLTTHQEEPTHIASSQLTKVCQIW